MSSGTPCVLWSDDSELLFWERGWGIWTSHYFFLPFLFQLSVSIKQSNDRTWWTFCVCYFGNQCTANTCCQCSFPWRNLEFKKKIDKGGLIILASTLFLNTQAHTQNKERWVLNTFHKLQCLKFNSLKHKSQHGLRYGADWRNVS